MGGRPRRRRGGGVVSICPITVYCIVRLAAFVMSHRAAGPGMARSHLLNPARPLPHNELGAVGRRVAGGDTVPAY